MIEKGRLCIKIAGRDAGKKCVIIGILDGRFVLIDGETRRRKCNILHLEPLNDVIKIKKDASHEDVKKEFKKLGLEARETKPKEKKKKPVKQKKKKKPAKDSKKPAKEKKKSEEKKSREKRESLEDKAGLKEDKSAKKANK